MDRRLRSGCWVRPVGRAFRAICSVTAQTHERCAARFPPERCKAPDADLLDTCALKKSGQARVPQDDICDGSLMVERLSVDSAVRFLFYHNSSMKDGWSDCARQG